MELRKNRKGTIVFNNSLCCKKHCRFSIPKRNAKTKLNLGFHHTELGRPRPNASKLFLSRRKWFIIACQENSRAVSYNNNWKERFNISLCQAYENVSIEKNILMPKDQVFMVP